ncbi:MAG: hypothetical protein JJ863_25480 [Deltaproteobacteria bacterium]|nr:hypothetical protein [Deltaproteobacteria bacterium]
MRLPTDDPRYREAYDQARKAKNEAEGMLLKLILVPVMLLIFAGVFGGVIWYVISQKDAVDRGVSPTAPAAPVAPQAWNGAATFECRGNDRVSLMGQTVQFTGTGPAIRAGANCQLTLTNMTITAPTVIEAGGNAQVMIIGGTYSATDKSFVATANAKISVSGATVTGDTQASGHAEITGL